MSICSHQKLKVMYFLWAPFCIPPKISGNSVDAAAGVLSAWTIVLEEAAESWMEGWSCPRAVAACDSSAVSELRFGLKLVCTGVAAGDSAISEVRLGSEPVSNGWTVSSISSGGMLSSARAASLSMTSMQVAASCKRLSASYPKRCSNHASTNYLMSLFSLSILLVQCTDSISCKPRVFERICEKKFCMAVKVASVDCSRNCWGSEYCNLV